MDYFQTPPKPKTSKRFFLTPVLFVILFLFISALFVFTYQNFQRTSPPLSSWQSYTNKEYGFMVSYPSTNIPKIIPTDTSLFLINFKNKSSEKAIWFSIQVDQNILNKEVELVRSQTEGHIPVTLTKKSEITHLGFHGIRLEYKPDNSDSGQPLTYIIVNNDIYSYTISSPSSDIDKVLSLFKFIDNIDDISTWKSFTVDSISFNYPRSWHSKDIPINLSDLDIYTEQKEDPNGIYILTFKAEDNLNKETKKPFTNLYEYLKMSNKIKEVRVDGQVALQSLPRAGSEYIYAVSFFSKDLKKIISFDLTTPIDGSKIQEGRQLFNQILTTFKFFDPFSVEITNWKTYTNKQYGFEFQYPKHWYLVDYLPESSLRMGYTSYRDFYDVDISVSDNKGISSSKAYLDKLISDSKTYTGGPGILKFASREDVIIGELPAGKLNNVFAYDHGQERIYVVKNNIVFEINYLINNKNLNYYEPIKNYDVVQKILSTFKFSGSADNIVLVTQKLLDKGWYQSYEKLSGTPDDWIYNKADGGGTGCWHKPNVDCY